MNPDTAALRTALVHAVFDGSATASGGLSALCRELVNDQRRTWPLLGQAYDSLERTLERTVPCTGFSVRVQRNPGRMASTVAEVDNGNTNGRPCFLCPDRLPPEQRGILYRGCYLILPNPMPALPFHCTVAGTRHEPQAISGRIDDFLRLSVDLGPDWTVLYNGPRCGASAPDHFHFQIIPAGGMPMEKEIREEGRSVPSGRIGEVLLSYATDMGRQVVVFEGEDVPGMERAFDAFFRGLRCALGEEGEPMLNLCGFCREARLFLVVFPRRKHRPDAFFKPGDDRIVVSPAVLEMGGVLVTPMERDFARLNGPLVEAIFAEVSLEAAHVKNALEAMQLASEGQ
jgi:hypothetical protein